MKAPKKVLKEQGYNLKDERLVLSMAEVAQALQEVWMLMLLCINAAKSQLDTEQDIACSMGSMLRSQHTIMLTKLVKSDHG